MTNQRKYQAMTVSGAFYTLRMVSNLAHERTTMSIFQRMFNKTLPQPRDRDGKFLPHRIKARKKAIEMATAMNRSDLVERLRKVF
jgi:hypothetical protein